MYSRVPVEDADVDAEEESLRDLDARALASTQRHALRAGEDHPPIDLQPMIDTRKASLTFRSSPSASVSASASSPLLGRPSASARLGPTGLDRPPVGLFVSAVMLALVGVLMIALSLPWSPPTAVARTTPTSLHPPTPTSYETVAMIAWNLFYSLRITGYWRLLSVPFGVFCVMSGAYTGEEYFRDPRRHAGGYLFPILR